MMRMLKKIAGWSWKKKIIVIICVVLTLVLGAAGAVFGYAASKVNKIQKIEVKKETLKESITEEVEHKSGYLNVAVFGLDSRDGSLDKGNRSDTIMIVSLNQETYEVKMVSVYRDTFMRLRDGSYNKANAAYSYFGPDGGVALLNENMDMNIEKYVSVNFNALVDVIDAVGGMDLELTDAEVVHMNNYCVETSEVTGKSYKKIEPEVGGSYHLNGVQAVSYARIRYTDGGDAQRTVRQRIVLLNIMQKLQQMDLTTINKIADSVFPQIATNFSFTEILNYAKDFQKYRVGETLGFPNVRYSKMLSGVGSTEIADTLASNVAEVHQFLFGDTDYQVSGTVKGIDDEINDALSSGKYEEADETEKEDEKSEDKTSEETNHTETNIKVTEDGNAGTDSGSSSGDSGSGSQAVTEPQQPDTEAPPDYYEEDYYYGDD